MKSKTLSELKEKGIKTLNEYEARQVLEEYDIPSPREVMMEYGEDKNGEDYISELEDMKDKPQFPLYFKIVSRDVLSKTDAGGIKRVTRKEEADTAVEEILSNVRDYDKEAEIQGILASEDVSNDTREMILGSTTDPQFGNLVSLGVGGIYVEVYKDVEFGIVPLEEVDIQDMIESLQGKKLLGEFRGMKPVDIDMFVETVLKFSKLVEENPEIKEADINPLLVGPDEIYAVDSLITI